MGRWGAPTMMALEGGSFGLQLGAEATDFVLLVMNDRGANGILASKVKLGGDASAAAGPIGRDASAETDASMRAEILSYSRARGVFAGVSLRVPPFDPITTQTIESTEKKFLRERLCLPGAVSVPPEATELVSTLDARTPKHRHS